MMVAQVVQHCPVCDAKYDVGIYVSGQRVKCRCCGNKFAVERNDSALPAESRVRGRVRAQGGVAVAGRAAVVAKAVPKDPPRERRVSDRELAPGTRIDGYEIEQVLGKGAMGTVYKANQLSLERAVALKLMAGDLVGQKEFELRFRREAAALAALGHTNIVGIIDQGSFARNWYFIMEYVPGPTLRRVLSKKAITLPTAFDYVLQIGRGLSFAHSKGVVHRDLKPENVLLAPEGGATVAKICDFGLADILYSDRSYVNLTGSRISMGTVNYMAPEQRQDAGRVDQRADVFSYGVVVYELLTGELPVGRFSAPSDRNRALDPRLDPVIMRALEQDARRRYPFVSEMVEAIDDISRRAS